MYQFLNEVIIPFGTKKGDYDYDDEVDTIGRPSKGEEILPPVNKNGRLWEIVTMMEKE